jgi:hypothetical protein
MRSLFITSATLAALILSQGCGGGSDPTVAQIEGVGSISKSVLQHWMPIEARIIYQEVPTSAPPKGVMPDPPNYAECITFLKVYLKPDPQTVTGHVGDRAELKRECDHQYKELKWITLNTLIGWYWEIGQGNALGIHVTDGEVKSRFLQASQVFVPKGGTLANYLRWTDESRADMLFRSRVQLYESKIHKKALAEIRRISKILDAKQREEEGQRLSAWITPAQRWVGKTTCVTGYVASSCREYRGPLKPGLPD